MSSTGNLGESAAPGEKRKRDDVEKEAVIGGLDGPSDERPEQKAARLSEGEETKQAQSSSSDSEDGGVPVGEGTLQGESAATGGEESTVPAVQENQQESVATGDEENNVPESEENAQPSLGNQPFPRPTPAAAALHLSPTPSTTSPWPAAERSETASTGTSPELARRPPPGREDNSAAAAALSRGPPEIGVHPEDSQKGALVHIVLTVMRLDAAGLLVEEQDMRRLAALIWPAAEMASMQAYLIGGDDAMPSPKELQRYARAMEARSRQPEDRHKEGGLVHAALTIIRLNAAQQQNVADQVRQRAALIWSEPDVQDMVSFLHRIGKGVLSAREERRFDNVSRGVQQPTSDDDSEYDPNEGAEDENE